MSRQKARKRAIGAAGAGYLLLCVAPMLGQSLGGTQSSSQSSGQDTSSNGGADFSSQPTAPSAAALTPDQAAPSQPLISQPQISQPGFSANAAPSAGLTMNPSSFSNPYYGSITMGAATAQTLSLTLDDAVERGVQANLALAEATVAEHQAGAQQLLSLNPLLPTVKGEASTSAHQYNLASFGFNGSTLGRFASLIPNFNPASFTPIVKVNVTQVDAALDWTAFDYAAITRYRAAKENAHAAYYNTRSSRGLVVLTVSSQYLKALADKSLIDSTQALERADELLLQQAQAEHEAGTVARLDELRARVQYQTQQQHVIAAQNAYEKDLVLLKREIGVPVEQAIALADTAPYADLELMPLEDARRAAYQNRQDYRGLERQVRAAQLSRAAARYERLPTVTASGNYGVTGETGGLYHGTFIALGEVKLPLFREAKFRGDADVAEAQKVAAMDQLTDLKQQIDQQLRGSMLDLNSSIALVKVSQQNVDLATRVLSDANDRFAAGIEDNLPVVQAQATLSQAQTQLISDTLQYNQAKLGLARNLGIVDTQYKSYLRGK